MIRHVEEVKHRVIGGQIEHFVYSGWLVENEHFDENRWLDLTIDNRMVIRDKRGRVVQQWQA